MSSARVLQFSASLFCFLFPTTVPLAIEGTAGPDHPSGLDLSALPPGALARLGSLRLRHNWEVCSIAFSPDGTRIASVGELDSTVQVWDTATGKLVHHFRAPGIFGGDIHASGDFALAFTPDGKSIAAGVGGDVCFWDCSTGRVVQRFRTGGKGIRALTFSRDNKTFFCGGSNNKLYKWDVNSGELLRAWDYFEADQPRRYASGISEKTATLKAISPDGKTAVWLVDHWADTGTGVGKDGWQLMIWDATTGKARCPVTDKNDKHFFDAEVVISPDGKFLSAYTRNNAPIVWDATTGKRVKTCGARGCAEAVAYSPDCRQMAVFACGIGYSLSIWDLATGKEVWCHRLAPWYARGSKKVAFSPEGSLVAVVDGRNVRLWNVRSGEETPLLAGHRYPVSNVVFAPKDGGLICGLCVCL